MKRTEHLFQFTGKQISDAASAERHYHTFRAEWWAGEQTRMVEQAQTLGAVLKVSEWSHTGGKGVTVTSDSPELSKINTRLQECGTKIAAHQKAADDFQIQAACYGTQAERTYELHPDDVIYFRLAGGPRAD